MYKLFAVFAVVLAIAGAWSMHQTVTEPPPKPQPACNWNHKGEAVCAIPTPGYPAAVVIRAYEDGSATVRVVDNGR